MNAARSHSGSSFRGVDNKEDGSLDIETIRCGHLGCEVYLCQADCEHVTEWPQSRSIPAAVTCGSFSSHSLCCF